MERRDLLIESTYSHFRDALDSEHWGIAKLMIGKMKRYSDGIAKSMKEELV